MLTSGLLLAFASSLITPSLAAPHPQNITIRSSKITDCSIPISASFSSNTSVLNILYDTTKSKDPNSDSLASTSTANTTETTCTVCTSFKWSSKSLSGLVSSVNYDFYNRLDPGTLEQVVTHMTMGNSTAEGYFESSYIYGDNTTAKTYEVQSNQPSDGDALVLDPAQEWTELCVQTAFRIYARLGAGGAAGEISKKSVFRQGVNIEWRSGINATFRL